MINFMNSSKKIKELEAQLQTLKNKPFFTNGRYNNTGKIELELTTGTYLFWIVTSGRWTNSFFSFS